MKNRILILSLVAGISAVLFSCHGGSNQIEPPKKIGVVGSAELEFVPNEIFMTFTLKEYLDAGRKKVKLESIKDDFLALCREVGVADSNISISSYTGNERWDYYWYTRRRKEPDFMSSISYAIKVSTPEKLDKIVSGLNENSIDNFYISKTSHSDIEQLRKDVKTRALIASKNKADYLAKSIGEELGEALLIQEVENNYNNYYFSNESNVSNFVSQSAMSYESANSSTPNFQKMKLRYEMKVEFRLK
ncbi:MAG: SIMPL domain-containing protein [Bacteroidetes bacterium]|nr:SIMPL domain-containing protein [Bacteroidota bacterium]MBU1719809.1 SIMPL domain-containing protein [Bacteroidota bacterium]